MTSVSNSKGADCIAEALARPEDEAAADAVRSALDSDEFEVCAFFKHVCVSLPLPCMMASVDVRHWNGDEVEKAESMLRLLASRLLAAADKLRGTEGAGVTFHPVDGPHCFVCDPHDEVTIVVDNKSSLEAAAKDVRDLIATLRHTDAEVCE